MQLLIKAEIRFNESQTAGFNRYLLTNPARILFMSHTKRLFEHCPAVADAKDVGYEIDYITEEQLQGIPPDDLLVVTQQMLGDASGGQPGRLAPSELATIRKIIREELVLSKAI